LPKNKHTNYFRDAAGIKSQFGTNPNGSYKRVLLELNKIRAK